jgi:hypothetical protein
MEHLSPHRSSIRGTWREDSYTENSERYVMDGSGKGAFLLYGFLLYSIPFFSFVYNAEAWKC